MAEIEDRITLQITIAGQRIPLTVPFNRQDDAREAEASIGRLYDEWRRKFPKKQDIELLAMIAYQYASHYLSMVKYMDEVREELDVLNRNVDSSIQSTPAVTE